MFAVAQADLKSHLVLGVRKIETPGERSPTEAERNRTGSFEIGCTQTSSLEGSQDGLHMKRRLAFYTFHIYFLNVKISL
jgi:hypothetical protein